MLFVQRYIYYIQSICARLFLTWTLQLPFGVIEFALYCICKQVNISLVEEMVECFFSTSPGMRCRLVESLMTASQDVASQYVGVIQADPSLPPNSMPEVIGDTTRFVWNFLADRTALQRENSPEKCTSVCKNPEEVCVGATNSHTGRCRMSATRYLKLLLKMACNYQIDRVIQVPTKHVNNDLGLESVWSSKSWEIGVLNL